MPRTMPVSTAHKTSGPLPRGLPERTVFRDEREQVAPGFGVRGESVRQSAASATEATAAFTERCPSVGSMRAAIERP